MLTSMATVYPADPPRNGETAEFAAHPDGPMRTLRAVAEDHWITDVVNGVQSEIWKTETGFRVITTNGSSDAKKDWATWREAMIHGI